jgi:5-methyltetrahydropteroyltriglutamate--homocysteine methyltransferase
MSSSELPIKTTVVGSYPIPTWLAARPCASSLRDALMVVLKTQELAGIDVIADGELARFDINHPETNGMIEYFINELDGIDAPHPRDLVRFRAQPAMRFRTRLAGIVRGLIGEQSDLSPRGISSHLTSLPSSSPLAPPYARKTCSMRITATAPLTMANADVLAETSRRSIRSPGRRSESARPGKTRSGRNEPINRVPPRPRVQVCISASATMAVKQSRKAFGKTSPNF